MTDPRARKLQEVLQRQTELVQQLRAEKNLARVPVSTTTRDMMAFMDEHAHHDYLLRGFPKPNDNPFVEKGKCDII
ncbi:hypothetical protein V1264_011121 [Littorina saxatilis]|uniref:G protein gamma domain-containing protein n=1 Tax=Littorina saxatilis TaxID=31220 RepID=A0AAN9BU85_9CAEN